MRRVCEITVALDFIFRLVLYSHEDVSFNIICLNVLEGILQFYLSMWFKKKRLEISLKGDNVNVICCRGPRGRIVILANCVTLYKNCINKIK